MSTPSVSQPAVRRSRKPNGRSSIYFSETDGLWHGWVTMGVKPDGSPDRRHRKGKTETEVTRKVRELEAKRDAGQTSRPGRKPTVAQWLRTYIETIAPLRVEQSTIDSTYRPKTERWIIPHLGKHRIDKLLPDHLYEFYAKLRDKGLSANTIHQIHRILSRALKVAVRQEIIARNPCTLIDAPQPEEAEIEPLTAAEARALLAAASARRNATRWSVAVALGLRQGEALGLRRRYVNLDRREILVHWQLKRERYRHGCDDPHTCGAHRHRYPCPPKDCPKAARKAGRPHVCVYACPPSCTRHDGRCPRFCVPDCTKHAVACPQRRGGWKFVRPKGRRMRRVPIPAELVEPLRADFEAQDAERAAAGDSWEDWELVWCQPNGRPIEPHEDWEEWKELLRDAGIAKDARVHDARHTAGTLLSEQGVALPTIQEILGHAQITTTRRYTHPSEAQARAAAGRMGAALFGAPEG